MARKTDEISTTEAENVDDSLSVSEVANTQNKKPHRWRARRQDRCEYEAHGDQAEGGKQHSKVDQIQVAEEQRVHDNGVQMMNTKQDGDEDSFESTEVSA